MDLIEKQVTIGGQRCVIRGLTRRQFRYVMAMTRSENGAADRAMTSEANYHCVRMGLVSVEGIDTLPAPVTATGGGWNDAQLDVLDERFGWTFVPAVALAIIEASRLTGDAEKKSVPPTSSQPTSGANASARAETPAPSAVATNG